VADAVARNQAEISAMFEEDLSGSLVGVNATAIVSDHRAALWRHLELEYDTSAFGVRIQRRKGPATALEGGVR